jgi:hypothetical protein
MPHKTWWISLLGTLALIVIAAACRERTWTEQYPRPWRQDVYTTDFKAIARTLFEHNIRGCGEFH